MKNQKKQRLNSYKNEVERNKHRYTLGEEIANAITHGIGALFGIFILIYGNIKAQTVSTVLGVTVFGITMAISYAISCIYHALKITKGKRVMRVLDHCSIYFLIAGTYTPFCLIALSGWIGYTILAINWVACIVGTTLTAIDRKKFKTFAMICYLAMGWVILLAFKPLIGFMGFGSAFWLLLLGGVSYTIGAVVFMIAKKKRYGHSIWHLFTLVGSLFHFLCIALII